MKGKVDALFVAALVLASQACSAPLDDMDSWQRSAASRAKQITKYRDQATLQPLLEDTSLVLNQNVFQGQVILTKGFEYEVLVAGAADYDLTTAGGLKLGVLRVAEPKVVTGGEVRRVYNVRAFGDIGDKVSRGSGDGFYPDATDAFRKAFRRSGRIYIPIGVYPVSRAIVLRNRTQLYVEQDHARGARVIHKPGTTDNLIRNANATAALASVKAEVAADSSVSYSNTDAGDEVLLADHRYVVVEADADYTDIENANGVKLRPALDTLIRVRGVGGSSGTNYAATFKQNGRLNRVEKVRGPDGALLTVPRWKWIGFLFENVDNVRVSEIEIQDTTKFGISCQSGCFNAAFHKIRFNQPGQRLVRDANGDQIKTGIPNQDCINIRHMSRHVRVAEIYGSCGDDAVALTALEPTWAPGDEPSRKTTQINMNVPYHQTSIQGVEARDIYDVEVARIHADPIGSHHVVRLLGSDDVSVHKIHIHDIRNVTSWKELEGNPYGQTGIDAAVLIGSSRYGQSPHASDSLIRNVLVENVETAAKYAVKFQWSASNVEIRNITSTWRRNVWHDGQLLDLGEGCFANLVRFERENETSKYDAPPKGLLQFSNITVSGGLLDHDGGRWDSGAKRHVYGHAVFIDDDIRLSDSSFEDLRINQADYAIYIRQSSTLTNVTFANVGYFDLIFSAPVFTSPYADLINVEFLNFHALSTAP